MATNLAYTILIEPLFQYSFSNFRIALIYIFANRVHNVGTSSNRDTPDPISNSEVKPVSADDSPLGESRSVPALCTLFNLTENYRYDRIVIVKSLSCKRNNEVEFPFDI